MWRFSSARKKTPIDGISAPELTPSAGLSGDEYARRGEKGEFRPDAFPAGYTPSGAVLPPFCGFAAFCGFFPPFSARLSANCRGFAALKTTIRDRFGAQSSATEDVGGEDFGIIARFLL